MQPTCAALQAAALTGRLCLELEDLSSSLIFHFQMGQMRPREVTVLGVLAQRSDGRAGTRIKVLRLPSQCLLCSSFSPLLPNQRDRLLFLGSEFLSNQMAETGTPAVKQYLLSAHY